MERRKDNMEEDFLTDFRAAMDERVFWGEQSFLDATERIKEGMIEQGVANKEIEAFMHWPKGRVTRLMKGKYEITVREYGAVLAFVHGRCRNKEEEEK